MQSSVNQLAGAGKRHVRRQSYGKIMPISSLLNNLIGSSTLLPLSSDERELRSLVQPNDTSSPSSPPPPPRHSFEPFAALNTTNRVNERSDSDDSAKNTSESTLNFIKHEKLTEQSNQSGASAAVHDEHVMIEEPAIAINIVDLDKAFLKCVNYRHSLTGGIEPLEIPPNAKEDPEDDIERVLTRDETRDECASCMICSNKAPIKHNLLNVLCKKLCDDSCNTSTKTCKSNDYDDDDGVGTVKSDASTVECVDEPLPMDDIKTNAESTSVKRSSNCSRQEFLASMLESDANDKDQKKTHENVAANHQIDGGDDDGEGDDDSMDGNDSKSDGSRIAPLTVENLEQFNHDYFREKLAIAEALAKTSMMTSPAVKRRLAARKMEMSLNTPDFIYDPENAEYIPPKELLMYLVR